MTKLVDERLLLIGTIYAGVGSFTQIHVIGYMLGMMDARFSWLLLNLVRYRTTKPASRIIPRRRLHNRDACM